jgi:hypothetical protein
VRKADEYNNAGRIDSAEDKRARLDSIGDADPAAPGAAEESYVDLRPRAARPTLPHNGILAASSRQDVIAYEPYVDGRQDARAGKRALRPPAHARTARPTLPHNGIRRTPGPLDRRSRTTASGRVVTTQHIVA